MGRPPGSAAALARRLAPSGWFRVGVACQRSGRHADALEAYEKVFRDKRFVRNRSLLHNLAVCRIRAHNYEGGLQALTKLDTLSG